MNIQLPNHVKRLNPSLSDHSPIIVLDDIQYPKVIRNETFEYNNKKQTFYRINFLKSHLDTFANITLTKEQYNELDLKLTNHHFGDIIISKEWSEDDLEIYKNSSWFSSN